MKKSSSSSSLAVEHSLLFETRSFALTIISDGCCYCRFFFSLSSRFGSCSSQSFALVASYTLLFHKLASYFLDTIRTICGHSYKCSLFLMFGLSHSVALRHTTPPNNQRMCSILIHESIKRRICACADRFTRNASKGKKGYTFLSISCFGPHRPYDTFHFHTAWPFFLILSLSLSMRALRVQCTAFGGGKHLKIETCSYCVSICLILIRLMIFLQ